MNCSITWLCSGLRSTEVLRFASSVQIHSYESFFMSNGYV